MQMASGFMQMTSGFMQMASGFMQLATTGCRRNILHCHCLFEGKCYLCIGMGITILKLAFGEVYRGICVQRLRFWLC